MISKQDIDNGFEYYNLDNKYKMQCYECCDDINSNSKYLNAFNKIYNILNYDDFDKIRKYWRYRI